MNLSDLRLYLVADPDHVEGDFVAVIGKALTGGVTMVQLRAKSLTDRQHLDLALDIRALCSRFGVPFIVNDRLDIALASDADGVHLGVDDLPVAVTRKVAGPDFIIGYSPETDAQIEAASSAGANYLGIGPVFGTRTKPDAGNALGVEEFARRCRLSRLPVAAIGGIDANNASAVMAAGASGVALVSAIIGSADPMHAARMVHDQVYTTVR